MNELTDCREVTRFTMTARGVKRLLEVVERYQTSEEPYRVAIVAPNDAVYGMARMYELMEGGEKELVRVFRSMDEAEVYTRG